MEHRDTQVVINRRHLCPDPDQLTFMQKNRLMSLLQNLGGTITVGSNRLDRRLRKLPVVVGQSSEEAATALCASLQDADFDAQVVPKGWLNRMLLFIRMRPPVLLLVINYFFYTALAMLVLAMTMRSRLLGDAFLFIQVGVGLVLGLRWLIALRHRMKPIAIGFARMPPSASPFHELIGRIRAQEQELRQTGCSDRDLDQLADRATEEMGCLTQIEAEHRRLPEKELLTQIIWLEEQIAETDDVTELEDLIDQKTRLQQALQGQARREKRMRVGRGRLLTILAEISSIKTEEAMNR